jgi:uncharacterized protein
MTTKSKVPQSRFVWHTLRTTSVEKARAFYGELLGWKVTGTDQTPAGPYTRVAVDGKEICGMTPLPAGAQEPSNWLSYLSVDDVDAGTKTVTSAGGKVIVPPADMPGVGRFSIVADPQGAVVSLFKGEQDMPEDAGQPGYGTFVWDELWTPDQKASEKLYRSLTGWGLDTMDMGPMGSYLVLKRGEKTAAGVMKVPAPGMPPFWLSYVSVKDVDEATARAKKLGATVTAPPSDIPTVGRFSILTDPTGAAVALFKPLQG